MPAIKVEIFTPQRGSKRAFLDLVENNAKHAFEQRFRVLKPTSKMIGEAVQNALNLLEEPRRIESFDISHMQGTDTVASMVVWENGRMKKSDYRKFIIRGEAARNGPANGAAPPDEQIAAPPSVLPVLHEKPGVFAMHRRGKTTILPACAKRSRAAIGACWKRKSRCPA